MKRKQVTTFTFGPAKARFPKLDQPYYYDNTLRKSVPDPQGKNKGSALTVELIMPEAEAAPMIAQIKQLAKDADLDIDEVKNWPFSKEKDQATKKPTGNVIFKLKKYATNRQGLVNTVTFVDSKMRVLPRGFRLTSGSTVKVNGYFQVYSELGGGVTLRLDSVQVLNLVERDANLSGFEAIEDGYEFVEDEGGNEYGGAEEGVLDNADF